MCPSEHPAWLPNDLRILAEPSVIMLLKDPSQIIHWPHNVDLKFICETWIIFSVYLRVGFDGRFIIGILLSVQKADELMMTKHHEHVFIVGLNITSFCF